MKRMYVLVVFCLLVNSLPAQTTFQRIYGGVGSEEGHCVKQTYDGGYIIAGTTSSFGAGSTDIYLLKVDSLGNHLWSKTFGGTGIDQGYSLDIMNDSGFVVCGYTNSFGNGGYDMYIIRTDSTGNFLWSKTYGGTDWDFGYSIKATLDSGFIVTGLTYSFGNGNGDAYVIKSNSNGDTLWTKTFGGTAADVGNDIQQTIDSCFVICGNTESFGEGEKDIYLIKINLAGDSLWTKTYGGLNTEEGNSIAQTADTGFIIAGYTNTFSTPGYESFYLVKTQPNGDTMWTKIEGAADNKMAKSIVQNNDSGYTITGVTTGNGNPDVLFWRTDANGNWVYSNTAGGFNQDMGYSIQKTNDGGFIIAGYTFSFGPNTPDLFLVKTDSTGYHPNVISVDELKQSFNSVFVYPNPFSTISYVSLPKTNDDCTFEIYNSLGSLVKKYIIPSQQTKLQIHREGLAEGIYLYKIVSGNKNISVGKIIIQ
jgi:hypothetical protein